MPEITQEQLKEQIARSFCVECEPKKRWCEKICGENLKDAQRIMKILAQANCAIVKEKQELPTADIIVSASPASWYAGWKCSQSAMLDAGFVQVERIKCIETDAIEYLEKHLKSKEIQKGIK